MGFNLHIPLSLFIIVVSLGKVPIFAASLNTDGVLLLSFKYSTLSDPLSVLENWNYDDETPCKWNGVTCTELGLQGTPDMFRVTSLVLPNSKLLGSLPPDLGFIQYLKHLDLSNNFLNGSLPTSFFNSTQLQVISLSGNEISGELPETIGGMKSLKLLNLSDNALDGKVPKNLTTLQNLTFLSLRSNYFSGQIPSGFNSVQVLDLSSNLLNGSLPIDFGGGNLNYLNLSYNKLSGSISREFAKKIPANASIDLSFNNLTGSIPESMSLLNQKTESFTGNVDLCGKPLKNLCSIPSTLSTPPNVSSTSPAIAVIPKPLESVPISNSSSETHNSKPQTQNGLKPTTIVTIAVADLAGIGVLALVILYVYRLRKKNALSNTNSSSSSSKPNSKLPSETIVTSKSEHVPTEPKKQTSCSCLILKGEETTSEEATTSDSDQEAGGGVAGDIEQQSQVINVNQNQKGGKLVIVDGETELDMETLLKASAYILGATGGSIVYKAVLTDGTAFAVRRIGKSGVERFRDFENQVRHIAKLRHPNLVRVRGFYWGEDEKLVLYDYVSNGSLATSNYKKPGSSPFHLPGGVRFKIARGIARGLAYLHEKKNVHGSIRPTNILLNLDMEPIISDFGLDRLVFGNNRYKASNSSGRNFGSQRSQDHPVTASPYTIASSSSNTTTSPCQPPESLKNLKPNPKWDVYSFGVILLELLTGRVVSDRELSQWTAGSIVEDRDRVLRLADVAIRADEDAMLACLRLGFSCVSFVPQKRPSMKEAVQVLEKIPSNLSN